MWISLLSGAVGLLLTVANPQSPRGQGEARRDSAMAAALARQDSALAARRRLVDSLNATQRPASPRFRALDRLNRGPFHEYTLAFYANLVCGALMGLGALLLRHRDAPAGARRWWGVVGVMVGAFFGAIGFMAVFMFFTMLSIGFNPMSTGGMFALSLLATAFAIAWLMSIRIRRLR